MIDTSSTFIDSMPVSPSRLYRENEREHVDDGPRSSHVLSSELTASHSDRAARGHHVDRRRHAHMTSISIKGHVWRDDNVAKARVNVVATVRRSWTGRSSRCPREELTTHSQGPGSTWPSRGSGDGCEEKNKMKLK